MDVSLGSGPLRPVPPSRGVPAARMQLRSWVEVRGNARRDKCTPVRLVFSECETGRGNAREDRAHPFRARILRCSDMKRGSRGLQCGQLSPDQMVRFRPVQIIEAVHTVAELGHQTILDLPSRLRGAIWNP